MKLKNPQGFPKSSDELYRKIPWVIYEDLLEKISRGIPEFLFTNFRRSPTTIFLKLLGISETPSKNNPKISIGIYFYEYL